MRPLETLHNNLCFKNLNNFLTRMINDRQSPYEVKNQSDKIKTSLSYTQQLSNSIDISRQSTANTSLEKLIDSSFINNNSNNNNNINDKSNLKLNNENEQKK